jgi:hypothetical protein
MAARGSPYTRNHNLKKAGNSMNILRFALPALLLVSAALAQDVRYNFDPQADFSKYKTYRWEKHPQSAGIDELTLGMLGSAFDTELAAKGLRKTEAGAADLVIVYQIAIRQEKEITSYNSGWGYGPGWRGGWYGPSGMSTATTSTIAIGSMALDMFDASKKNLVWRGMAEKALEPNAKPDKQRKNAAKAAEKLLKNYPPKKKS